MLLWLEARRTSTLRFPYVYILPFLILKISDCLNILSGTRFCVCSKQFNIKIKPQFMYTKGQGAINSKVRFVDTSLCVLIESGQLKVADPFNDSTNTLLVDFTNT